MFLSTRGWWLGGVVALAMTAALTAPVEQTSAADRPVIRRADFGRPQTPIKHIIFILKENRSFDEYFGALSRSNPDINGATSATRSDGTVVDPLPQTPDPLPSDISHQPAAFVKACHADASGTGRNDGFDREGGAYSPSGTPLALSQMQPSTMPHYSAYATTYGLGDNMFASWRGASFGNNLYEFAGQAGRYDTASGCVRNAAQPGSRACHTGGRSVYGIPRARLRYWGCDDPAGTLVQMIRPRTGRLSDMYPCYRFRSLPNRLSWVGVSWKSYSAAGTRIHQALDAISSIRDVPRQWDRVRAKKRFVEDVRDGSLPAVSWLVPKWTDHPLAPACYGENELVRLVNLVMRSRYWSSTAIVVTWDEWGGFYDHVSPPNFHGNPAERISYGFRVPLLVISPFVKSGNLAWKTYHGGYVNHAFFSHASLLKFVEKAFKVPGLGADDSDPTTGGNLMSFFDFSRATPRPRLFLRTRTCPRITGRQWARIRSSSPD